MSLFRNPPNKNNAATTGMPPSVLDSSAAVGGPTVNIHQKSQKWVGRLKGPLL